MVKVPQQYASPPQGAADSGSADRDTYARLISLLDAHGARYRVIDHAPEGRTEVVSRYRGHPVAHAAKCLVVMVKTGKRSRRYFLAVVSGDARVDLQGLKALAGGTYVSFASTDKAEALSGSVSGTILPFSFHPDLELVVDPGALEHPEIFFNAARLDRSLSLNTQDYRDHLRRIGAQIRPIATREA
ncbi:YbaK/EbsC family protein [Streptomyces hoynatensis]|uniref:YbaK/prolyl-tRNA synthetase associated domain-containing protein n=1 Tax=Streptomyces hoynatensis TaxID=1141874 RepID=A0A3A9YSU8_9ACTN|nr:YbaK/EbsC family protein [Streptomyces hoynatensis]RKN38574.1 YbaK/prolyl-tRNA synthetase associated domain-containing protein [Streptomyces hoynatensis]